jgi:hypothetical protein
LNEASSFFMVAALNLLALVMVADLSERGPWRTSGIVINGVFAVLNAFNGFRLMVPA